MSQARASSKVLIAVVLTLVASTSAAQGSGNGSAGRLAQMDLGRPAAATSESAEWVRQELANHPEWPQREIMVQADGRIALPFAPGDPPAYREWMKDVAEREQGAVVAVYAPADGDPTQTDLDAVSSWIMERVNGLPKDASPAFSLRPDLWRGATVFTYAETGDADFLNVVAEVQRRFGSRVVVAVGSVEKAGPQSLTTKGGYGITSSNQAQTAGQYCTLGFNMVKNGEYHFVTAAHCAENGGFSGVASTPLFYAWGGGSNPPTTSSAYLLGEQSGSLINPPTGDLAAVKYTTANAITKFGVVYPGAPHIDVVGTDWGRTGDWVCTFGAKSLVPSSSTNGTCNFINSGSSICYYPQAYITGVLAVDLYTVNGDSGAPLWKWGGSDTTAIGVGVLSGLGQDGYRCFTDVQRAVTQWGLTAY